MANTTNLNLVKPAGTDKALVSVINSNSDKIDAFAGTTTHRYRYTISGTSVVSITHISDAIGDCYSAGYRGSVAIEFYRTDQSIVAGTLWYNMTSERYGAGILTSYYNNMLQSVIVINGTINMEPLALNSELLDLNTSKSAGTVRIRTYALGFALDPNYVIFPVQLPLHCVNADYAVTLQQIIIENVGTVTTSDYTVERKDNDAITITTTSLTASRGTMYAGRFIFDLSYS